MDATRDRKKFNFGLTCSKYMLFVLNFLFAITSVLLVSSGISTKIIFDSYDSYDYYYYNDMSNGFQMLSTFWLVVGIIFMFVGMFGIFVAFKESTVLANLYGIAMIVVFILQISAAIAGFTLITRSRYMVNDQLSTMMRNYHYDRLKIDWIQTKFECCGKDGPNDWQNYDVYSTPSPNNNHIWYDGYGNSYGNNRRTIEQPTTVEPRTNLMPVSCCVRDSDYVNLTCNEYYEKGCTDPLHQIVSESIMMIGSSSLVLAVVQILGVVLGFMYARIVRRNKSQRDMQIWNSSQEPRPVYADYSQVDNQSEVKYI